MGMYTELRVYAKLKPISEDIRKTIEWIKGGDDTKFDFLPDHKFFSDFSFRNNIIFTCDRHQIPLFYMKGKDWYLDTHAEIKNYESEIEEFIDWFTPYVAEGLLENGAFAFSHYEEYTGETFYFIDHIEDNEKYEY